MIRSTHDVLHTASDQTLEAGGGRVEKWSKVHSQRGVPVS